MIKHVFLDLDDTIFDFHKAERIAIAGTLSMLGVEPTDATLKRYSEINRSQWELLERGELTRERVLVRRFELLFKELGIEDRSVEARRNYESRLAIGHYFMEGAEELLDALYGKYRLYLASNGTKAVQDGRIASSGISKYFDRIFISQEVGYDKPSPLFFDACFAAIDGFKRDEAIIVGDSLTSDIKGGINAGIRTCHFNVKGTEYKDVIPDYTVTKLSELPKLLESI